MISRIANQQLAAVVRRMAARETILNDLNSSVASQRSPQESQSDKKVNNQKMKFDFKLVFQARFNYRSQQRFIDFRKDYYQILNISESAELHQIKHAFYILAKQYHPDRNKGDDSKFKEINEAYNVLSQPNLKKEYDQSRFREPDHEGEEGATLKDEKAGKASLNYGAYSQLSRLEWAIYRSGYMKHSTTDYTNYQKTYDCQFDTDLDIKNKRQWDQAFRNMTEDQLKEQVQFRRKIAKKYYEDQKSRAKARQEYIDKRFKQIGNKIQRFLGKRMRRWFDKLIEK